MTVIIGVIVVVDYCYYYCYYWLLTDGRTHCVVVTEAQADGQTQAGRTL